MELHGCYFTVPIRTRTILFFPAQQRRKFGENCCLGLRPRTPPGMCKKGTSVAAPLSQQCFWVPPCTQHNTTPSPESLCDSWVLQLRLGSRSWWVRQEAGRLKSSKVRVLHPALVAVSALRCTGGQLEELEGPQGGCVPSLHPVHGSRVPCRRINKPSATGSEPEGSHSTAIFANCGWGGGVTGSPTPGLCLLTTSHFVGLVSFQPNMQRTAFSLHSCECCECSSL